MTLKNTSFGPIRVSRTFEEVSNKIKEMIFDGVLKPGEKLPSEMQMAEIFQVGRQSVREAMRLLELSGFITIQRGVNGGAVIKNTILNKMASMYKDAFKFNRISVSDFRLARSEIGKSVILLAFDNIEEADFEALDANISNARKRLSQGFIAFDDNVEFHRLLAKASKNHVFLIVMESLLSVNSDLRSRAESGGLEHSRRVIESHAGIVQALKDGDRNAAMAWLEENMKELEHILNEDLGL